MHRRFRRPRFSYAAAFFFASTFYLPCHYLPTASAAEKSKPSMGYDVAVLNPRPGEPIVPIRANQDYYSVFIDSVFLNREETWWNKNTILVMAELTIDEKRIPVTIYDERDPKVSGKLGIGQFGVMNLIPCNGTPVSLKISVIRQDRNDPMKKLLTFVRASKDNATLTTYAANAIPYLSIIGETTETMVDILGGQSNNTLFSFGPITFTPVPSDNGAWPPVMDPAFNMQRGDPGAPGTPLQDMSFVLLKTEDDAASPKYIKMFEQPGNDRLIVPDLPKGRGMWVKVSIRRQRERLDYTGRDWFRNFTEAEVLGTSAAASATINEIDARSKKVLAEKKRDDGLTLLLADKDFTLDQKRRLQTEWESRINTLLGRVPKETRPAGAGAAGAGAAGAGAAGA